MAKTAILAVKIISDARNASQGFDQAASGIDKFQAGIGKAATVASAATAGLVAIGTASVQAASEAQQAAGAVESVFGTAATQVHNLANTAAQSVGLAASEYNNMAAVLGSQLMNLGVSQDQIVGKTSDLIKLGADLAATYGGTTADAVRAISALFRGEADPIERYSVSIKQSDVNARLAAEGLSGLDGEAKKQAETQARLALLYEQSGAALDQFGRESNTLAGQQQRMNAEFENAKAKLGSALLPVLTQVAQAFAGVASWIGNNTGLFWTLVGVVGSLAAVLITINTVMTVYQAVSAAVAAIKAIETGAWLANAAAVWAASAPILLIIAIIAAVVAAVILVIRNLDTLRGWWDIAFEAGRTAISAVWSFLQQVGSWIAGAFTATVSAVGNVFQTAFNIAKAAVNALLAPIRAVISAVQSLIGWISKIKLPNIGGFLSKLNPFSVMIPDGAPAPALAALTGPAPYAAARVPLTVPSAASIAAPVVRPNLTNVQIIVQGAIDPVQTGRQIRKALTGTDRAIGAVNAVRLSDDRGRP